MSATADESDALLAKLGDEIDLQLFLRSLNEALESMASAHAPLTNKLEFVQPPAKHNELLVWVMRSCEGFSVSRAADFCELMSVEEGMSDDERASHDWYYWQKATRTNMAPYACTLALLVFSRLHKAGKRIVLSAQAGGTRVRTHRVTGVTMAEAAVRAPATVSPFVKRLNEDSVDLAPLLPLNVQGFKTADRFDEATKSLVPTAEFAHRWVVLTLEELNSTSSESARPTLLMSVDFAGPAIDVFLDDSQVVRTSNERRLPLVYFFHGDPDLLFRASYCKYAALLRSRQSILDAQGAQRFASAFVEADRRAHEKSLLPPMLMTFFTTAAGICEHIAKRTGGGLI